MICWADCTVRNCCGQEVLVDGQSKRLTNCKIVEWLGQEVEGDIANYQS